MQVSPVNTAAVAAAQAGGVASVRVLAGNLSAVPTGTLLQATVTQVAQGQAQIVVNGQTLTVRTTATLQPGTVLFVRAPNGSATPTLDLVGGGSSSSNQSVGQTLLTATGTTGTETGTTSLVSQLANAVATTPQASQTASLPSTLQLSQVDVLSVMPDGRIRVQIDGQEEVATSTEQLAAGGRYVLEVERTPGGLTLSSAPDTPNLPATVSAAILRGSLPPDLGAALKPLLEELANLQTTQPSTTSAISSPLQKAAATVGDALRGFLPSDGRPLNATELQNLVENGGLHFEAKLGRLVSEDGPNTSNGNATYSTDGGATARSNSEAGPDLKEALLRLLQTAQELGNSVQLPAARTTLNGIESQQAANVFAQSEGTPYILQIPFPDGGAWRTLNLAIEPDGSRRQNSDTSGFRMLMHVPLTDLGETWIDAGVAGNNLRAILYLSNSAAREQVRTDLPALRTELLGGGFNEVLLDVRAASELPAQQRKQAAAMQIGRPGSGSVLDVRA